MGRVRVIYGKTIHTMVQRLLVETSVLDSGQSHDTVGIKPNLVVSQRDWQGQVVSTTHQYKDKGQS